MTSTSQEHKPLAAGSVHVAALAAALGHNQDALVATTRRWGRRLAQQLPAGGRLLAAGNGGSAAQAQHLTAELTGRYRDDRPAMSALALHAETSTVTAVGNDYGFEHVFARQVEAHGRRGDVLVLLSTSGRSPNLVEAGSTARRRGLSVWALTGPAPNPLADVADELFSVDGAPAATVQELHLVAVHLMCAEFDVALGVCPAAQEES